MCLLGIVGRPGVSWVSWGVLGCPGVIRLTDVGLSVITIQCTIQIANQIMKELNQLGFAGPLTSETMLTVSKNAFKG